MKEQLDPAPTPAEFRDRLQRFMGAFEVVMHYDWEYTQNYCSGNWGGRTFLNDHNEEREFSDWICGNELMASYRLLREAMSAYGMQPDFYEISDEWPFDRPKERW